MSEELEAAIMELVDAVRAQDALTKDAAEEMCDDAGVGLAYAVDNIRRLFAERPAGLPQSIQEALNSGDATYRP